MSENTGGKGSKPRPIFNREQFEQNWDVIFGKKDSDENSHGHSANHTTE